MTKKHEELVNEIAGELNILFCAGRDGSIPKQLPQDLAKSLVTLTLSAVRDGQLDEELGVVGRYSAREKGVTGAIWQMDMYLVENAREFIALRPPTIELDEPSFIAEIH